MTKKCLVTGAGGFIGSHLVERLTGAGWEVRAFVRYNSRSHAGWLEHRDFGAELFRGDIRDATSVQEAVNGCDTVFHLAALIGIPYSYRNPQSYLQTNIQGTLNLLQAAGDAGCERVIITSTSEVYGSAREVPQTEEHPLSAQSPYAASKIAADQLALAWHRSFELPVTVVRPFNTYGPRQSARAVIPAIMTQILSGSNEIRLGSTTPRRDLSFVANTVDAFLSVLDQPDSSGRIIHFGSGSSISIGELAARIQEVAGSNLPVTVDKERFRPPASEVSDLVCDYSNANRLCGWEPRVGLTEGLVATWEWFQQQREGSSGSGGYLV
ncbi:MAG: SDR family NAD(P)-dependent oxidoreductase [Candidatus Delongbacteria bacterium]|nr:SDR family NAD(P)-dependent oxidoreductase [Candidatus Delongbacteria bacterium]